MKITKTELRRIIREEFIRLREGYDNIGKPIFSLAGIVGQDDVGEPISILKPTNFTDWKSKLPAQFRMPCITSKGVTGVLVPKNVYLPFLEAFYKFMGMGNVEDGINKISEMPLDQFSYTMPMYKTIEKSAGAGQVAGALRIEKQRLLVDLQARYNEFARYLEFKMSRENVPGQIVWAAISQLSHESIPEELLTPELVDLDKAILFTEFSLS